MLISIKLISNVDKDIKKFTSLQSKRPQKHRIVLFLKIFVITGLSWILAIISTVINNKYSFLWYVFVVLGSLQGFFIMCIFVFNDSNALLICSKVSPHSYPRFTINDFIFQNLSLKINI
ncbi:G- coupled receptor Mth2-like [Brachionus plicatilis]|uniref:G-coupled receptor Mth2-like n=1 Tax=Brachionus plicatilis TaxID=10195 RepID=A0A3M7Q469_BRAPC|nr:G- coupled receptor Mth2-like [Brachionus plicatilis]